MSVIFFVYHIIVQLETFVCHNSFKLCQYEKPASLVAAEDAFNKLRGAKVHSEHLDDIDDV
jgi:hypothetical protein